MNVNHVQWENDSLVFYFSKMKGDQSGDNSGDTCHLYSNPKNPGLCPVIELEKYLLSHPDLLNGNFPLLPVKNQYDRFIKVFRWVIHYNKDTFHIIGMEEHSLGSHTCRKVGTTMCSLGCTVSPPMASICLRDCWRMVPVKDQYVHYEKDGDQFTGGSVTIISSLRKEFSISPPHWDFTDSIEEGMKEKVDKLLSNNPVRENYVSGSTFLALLILFASICYHYEHLERAIHEKNGLRGSPIFIAAARAG